MTTENLERAFASTRALVADVKPDELSAPTPCASWDVRALLNHIIGVAYFFAATVNDGTSPARGNPAPDFTTGDMVAAYDAGIAGAVTAFAAAAPDAILELPFGVLPASAFIGIATTDVFVHGWDLARALGRSTDLDPDLAAQLLVVSKQLLQPSFRGADGTAPFGPEMPAPAGASAADQLADFLGRTV